MKWARRKRLPELTTGALERLVGAFPLSPFGEFEGSSGRSEAHEATDTTDRPLNGNDPRRGRPGHDRLIRGGVDCVQHVVPPGVGEPINSAADWATRILWIGTLVCFAHRVLLWLMRRA